MRVRVRVRVSSITLTLALTLILHPKQVAHRAIARAAIRPEEVRA